MKIKIILQIFILQISNIHSNYKNTIEKYNYQQRKYALSYKMNYNFCVIYF